MKTLLAGILFFITTTAFCQQVKLSPRAEISVITCGPGSELYASFGHSAFRIEDPLLGLDRVYNYGTFDFDTPNFYLKFARGKLMYELSAYDFRRFLGTYRRENRWVKSQVLALDSAQKQQIFEFLEHNAKPENKSYQYDFFFDNCATKIRDVVSEVLGEKVTFGNDHLPYDYSHRDLIQLYLNESPWADFGIDLGLGSTVDKKAAPEEYMFLPDFVLQAFDHAVIVRDGVSRPIVEKTETVFSANPDLASKATLFSPLVVFSLLGLLVIGWTYWDYRRRRTSTWLDFFLLLVTGLSGLLMSLLWFATDHAATVANLNVFWAFAPNMVVAFLLFKKKKWLRGYFRFLFILLMATVFTWLLQVQVFSIALVPILIFLGVRYLFLWRAGLVEKAH